jgi:hypothetical protein
MANELRVRDFQLPILTLTADYDPGSDSTIAAAELADYPVIDATNHLAVWINRGGAGGNRPYLRYITAHTASSTTATVGAAAENLVTPYAVSAGVTAHHGSTLRDLVLAGPLYTAGGAGGTINSTNWANMPNTADILLPCYAGDVIGVLANWRCQNENVWALFDAWADPDDASGNGAYAMSIETTPTLGSGDGFEGWVCGQATRSGSSGEMLRLAPANRIVAGVLRLRAKYRTVTAANRSLGAWQLFAKRYGPEYEAPVYA